MEKKKMMKMMVRGLEVDFRGMRVVFSLLFYGLGYM
jgi:hypothetical protein